MNLANGDTNKFFSLPESNEDRYYVENFNTDEDSYNNYVKILSNEVPDKSVVIDVGCAQGKFGYCLSKKNCIVYGIERDHVSAKHAISSGNYKDIFIFDVLRMEGKEYDRFVSTVKYADVIIIADVLEHMADPTSVLFTILDFLKENGTLLVSVPNIAHADIYLKLMNGIFNYTDLGILDNTHLKFFTKRSFMEWIDLFNYCYPEKKVDCKYLESSYYYSDYLLKIREKQRALFQIIEIYPEFNSLQLLFKLTKLSFDQKAEELTNALAEKQTDIVEVLGSVIEGRCTDHLTNLPAMPRSERSWYDYAIMNMKEKIDIKDWEISQRDERIEALLKYISELEAQVKKFNTIQAVQDTYVSELKENSIKKDKRIEDLLKYVVDLENEVKKKAEVEGYLSELKADSDQKDKRIEALLEYVTELEIKIKEETTSHAAINTYLNDLKENIVQKDERIEALLKYVSDLENEVKNKAIVEGYVSELKENSEQKDKRIEELIKYVSELEAEACRKETCIADANIQLNQMVEKTRDLEYQYKQNESEAKARMEKLTEDLRTARKAVFDMENSISWKVTKVLRRNK